MLLVSLRMLKPALGHPAPLLLVFSSEEGVENSENVTYR